MITGYTPNHQSVRVYKESNGVTRTDPLLAAIVLDSPKRTRRHWWVLHEWCNTHLSWFYFSTILNLDNGSKTLTGDRRFFIKDHIQNRPRSSCHCFFRLSDIRHPKFILLGKPILKSKLWKLCFNPASRAPLVICINTIPFSAVLNEFDKRANPISAERPLTSTTRTGVWTCSFINQSNAISHVLSARVRGLV